jgi:hypothetical protein
MPGVMESFGKRCRLSGKSVYNKNSPSNQSKFKRSRFIAWDGEGIGKNYFLLMNNEEVVAYNPQGLSTAECLDTIMSTDAIHVGFAICRKARKAA